MIKLDTIIFKVVNFKLVTPIESQPKPIWSGPTCISKYEYKRVWRMKMKAFRTFAPDVAFGSPEPWKKIVRVHNKSCMHASLGHLFLPSG